MQLPRLGGLRGGEREEAIGTFLSMAFYGFFGVWLYL